jgi:hypothetical protein
LADIGEIWSMEIAIQTILLIGISYLEGRHKHKHLPGKPNLACRVGYDSESVGRVTVVIDVALINPTRGRRLN